MHIIYHSTKYPVKLGLSQTFIQAQLVSASIGNHQGTSGLKTRVESRKIIIEVNGNWLMHVDNTTDLS